MNAKLKLKLRSAEVVGLQTFLAAQLAGLQMHELRAEPTDFLILSALYEVYAKVKPISEDIRVFQSRRTDKVFSLTITRTQALAISCVNFDQIEPTSAVQSYEKAFMTRLVGLIHQTFLI